ncbi:hypothetical protein KP806_18695 [Paenibacillus sp. N4]|uniref:hypothetical protein n=1 Tax=Paenibacillus vietnamensis TaxID=2590547 RepID=UPI001CD17852|nr:hypothetical protein [Paenibacillus vietnamensis]MCA0757095.1 hypothetical protein [Paenibacillus vietnamensis]
MIHAFAIKPVAYTAFGNEAEQLEKCKEWGLLSEKAVKTKTFYYKGNGMNVPCAIIGFADKMTAVIQFDNGELHCIHPSFLKEMQAASYGAKAAAAAVAEETAAPESTVESAEAQVKETVEKLQVEPGSAEEVKSEDSTAEEAASKTPAALEEASVEAPAEKPKKGKGKKEKLQLPEEKVKMTATVQEFTTVPNNFSDNDDEVIIYEAVSILEPALELGVAWSSHSATLKKLELAIGDTITFDAKVVAKKLTKHPVPYKINNPAKIQKG